MSWSVSADRPEEKGPFDSRDLEAYVREMQRPSWNYLQKLKFGARRPFHERPPPTQFPPNNQRAATAPTTSLPPPPPPPTAVPSVTVAPIPFDLGLEMTKITLFLDTLTEAKLKDLGISLYGSSSYDVRSTLSKLAV